MKQVVARTGDHNGRNGAPPATPRSIARRIAPSTLRTLRSFPIAGVVVNAATGYPLAGVAVLAYAADPDSDELLGRAVTDAEGRFRIPFQESVPVIERLTLLALHQSDFELKVEGLRGSTRRASRRFSGATRFPIVLEEKLPARQLSAQTWKTIGTRMEEARIGHLHELARQLVLPASQSAFADLDLETRQSALLELERGFLDPQGVLRAYGPPPTFYAMRRGGLEAYQKAVKPASRPAAVRNAFAELAAKSSAFSDLMAVDWAVDTVSIKEAKVGPGTTKFQDSYTVSASATQVKTFAPTDLSRYRDYLRTILTGGVKSDTYAPNRAKLESRFHQDFVTLDTSQKPANGVLIPILKTILTAPKNGGHGFGIAAGTIQPKGARTSREYLDYLIGLSKLSAHELGLRYRLDLSRPDSALSSRVAENIFTLQRFYSDGFEGNAEPYTIVPTDLQGRAPFFLYYEEWLGQTGPFYGENFYQPVQTFSSGVEPEARKQAKAKTDGKWVGMLIDLEDKLAEARELLEESQAAQARDKLLEADAAAREALAFSYTMDGSEDFTPEAIAAELDKLVALPMKSPADLQALIDFYRIVGTYELDTDNIDPYDKFKPWLDSQRLQLWIGLIHLVAYVIPTYLGDTALMTGDYAAAIEEYRRGTHFFLARADANSQTGYPGVHLPKWDLATAVADPSLLTDWQQNFDYYGGWSAGEVFYHDGGLPYTVDLAKKREPDPYEWYQAVGELASPVKDKIHPTEQQFFRLRQGNAMLEWADALYRTDNPSSIERARELYKSVLWLHGGTPPTVASWSGVSSFQFRNGAENPALVSQRSRAHAGILQIEAGLNYYGFNDSLVPTLRYRPLKDAADRYAATAKAAQQDFLLFVGKIEDALRESLVTTNMLKKAQLQGEIADEQAKIAAFGVTLAQQQVAQVQAAIDAKKQEIEDHDDLFSQFKEVISGMVDVIGGMPSGLTGKVATGAEAGVGLSEAGGMSAAAAGGAVLGAYAIFLYAGVTSLSNMADAQEDRHHQLDALQNTALPLAQAQVEAKQREVTIANFQRQIAEADAELAEALIRFQATRFLNTKFWAELATLMRRVMRRYLALGAKFGWLGERALAFEQDRQLDIIRFDYFPMKLQGVTGADLLGADLAELEAARLDGLRQTLPVKRTYSLAFDFPLHFAQLKKTGSCTFMTREQPLRYAHPGAYGYRVRAVDVAVKSYSGTPPVRGLLSNLGVSKVSRSGGEMHVLLRNQDALPVSQFQLASDMTVFGLPDESLLSFEGSGVETLWRLELPPAGNDSGLGGLADVEVTLDLRAQYSSQLHEKDVATLPTSTRRFVFVSSAKYQPDALADLRGDAQSPTFELDLTSVGLPKAESSRKVKNLVVIVAAPVALTFTAAFGSDKSPDIALEIEGGFAVSNGEPLSDAQSSLPPEQLNAFIDTDVDQTFHLAIDKSTAGLDFAEVVDVVLGVEYTADIQP